MRGAGISEFDGAVGRIDLPDPRPLMDDEVLIEVRAAGVGNWEEFVRTGEWDIGRAPRWHSASRPLGPSWRSEIRSRAGVRGMRCCATPYRCGIRVLGRP